MLYTSVIEKAQL